MTEMLEGKGITRGVGFELPPELEELKRRVRGFVQGEVIPLEAEMGYDEFALPEEKLRVLQGRAREAGLWLPGAPKEYGGGGMSIFAQTIFAEEASKHRNGAYSPGLRGFGDEPPSVIYSGTQGQIERFAVPTLEGRRQGFVAITEPGGGADPVRAIEARAEKRNGGWVLNGEKVYSTNAVEGDYGVVFARTSEGRDGITAFVVEKGMGGVSVEPMPVIRPYSPGRLLLEGVEVPQENVLGEVGQGFNVAQTWLVRNRIPYAAGCVGIGQAALEMAIERARSRVAFKTPLAEKQAVQWMLADSEMELRSARWLTWEAAWKADRGEPCRTEVSLAKLAATETANRVVDRAVQIHGGAGVEKDLPLERWFRELRIKRIGEGPSEVHRMVIARDLLNPSGRRA